MKIKVLFACLGLLVSTFTYAQNDAEVASVKACFEEYKTAILANDGPSAIQSVDKNTLDYFAKARDNSLKASKKEVQSMNLLDKLMVLTIRNKISASELKNMSGRDMLLHAIKEGMVGKNTVENQSLQNIEVNGSFAKGQMVAGGLETPIFLHFHKESGNWRVDLTSIFEDVSAALGHVVEQSGQTEDQFVMFLLDQVSEEKVPETIWEAPIK